MKAIELTLQALKGSNIKNLDLSYNSAKPEYSLDWKLLRDFISDSY